MKRLAVWLQASVMLVFLVVSACSVHARQPANVQFYEAYRTLIRADVARDESRFVEALELYRASQDTYVRLMREFPDWEPGATRFRVEHCQREAKRIARLEAEGLISTKPATDGAGSSVVPVAAAPRQRGLTDLKVDAVKLLDKGEAEAARTMLMAGMDINPDDVPLRVLIGMAQCQSGRFHDAVFLARNLLEEDPYNAHAHAVLGTAYFGLARYADAAVAMKKASDSDPILCEPHFNLAQIFLAMDPADVTAAGYHYRKALRLGARRDPSLELKLVAAAEPAPAPDPEKTVPPPEPALRVPEELPVDDAERIPMKLPEQGASAEDGNMPEKPESGRKSWLQSITPW